MPRSAHVVVRRLLEHDHATGVDRAPVDQDLLAGLEPGIEAVDVIVEPGTQLVLAGVHRRPTLAHGVSQVAPTVACRAGQCLDLAPRRHEIGARNPDLLLCSQRLQLQRARHAQAQRYTFDDAYQHRWVHR